MKKHVINHPPQKMPLGELIKFLRTSTDKTQAELADMLGVQQSFLSAVERGQRKMPEAWHVELFKEFGKDFSENITKEEKQESVPIERTNTRTNRSDKGNALTNKQPSPRVFISHSSKDKEVIDAARLASNFDVTELEPRTESPWAIGYVSELNHKYNASIQRQLERVLGRLLRVEELLEDLVGLRFDDANYKALRENIIQPLRFDAAGNPSDPIAEMTEVQKRAYYAGRERLLDQCEGQLTYLLETLHASITHPANLDHPPRKGSAGEALRPFLEERHRWRYGNDENE